jgi:hypothetical protein
LQTSIRGLGDPGAFVVPSDVDGVLCVKLLPPLSRQQSVLAGWRPGRDEAPLKVVCLALALATPRTVPITEVIEANIVL